MSQHLSEQEIIRREKLKELHALNIDAYPAALYPVTHFSKSIKEQRPTSKIKVLNLTNSR